MRIFSKRTSGWQRSRPAALCALRARLDAARADGEQGFLLIEVMVSAMLVALIAVGTFSAFDVSGRVTADERAHLQATALAEQDQERLRGLGTEELASLNESKTVTEQEVEYTVTSKSQFVSDKAGTSSCASAGASADYYETTSEVTWASLKNRPKIVETGIVAPPAGGELTVTINDGRGGKVPGMLISGTGPQSFSGTTGSNGCLIFGPLEEGAYTVHATQAGYVNFNGESDIPESERALSMTAQTTSNKEWAFNKPGLIKATLETRPTSIGGTAQAMNVVATEPTGLSAWGGYRTLILAANETAYLTSNITSPQTFFPFQNGYAKVYAGSCLANDPTKWGIAATEVPKVQVEPGATGIPAKSLIEPAMVLLAYTGSGTSSKGSLVASPEIYITEADGSECSESKMKMKTVASPATTKGDLESPGLPFGKYTVCLQYLKSTTKYHITKTIENKSITAPPKEEFFETGSSATTGTC